MEVLAIKAAAKECFVDKDTICSSVFCKALQKRNVETRKKLARIVESTDFLALTNRNNDVVLTKRIFTDKALHAAPSPRKVLSETLGVAAAHPQAERPVMIPSKNVATAVAPLSISCDTQSIIDLLGDIAIDIPDLDDVAVTDIFIDVGSNTSVKANAQCVQGEKLIASSDLSTILQKLPGEDPDKQYATLLDCVRNHSPDIIAIDELHTKHEVDVCQTIALRSIQMVASVHGNIEDLVFNPMLNKALGGSTEALVSDRNAVDGKKVVMQRTTRPIFDVVINIKRTLRGLEYTFMEDVANNVSRIMQGKSVQLSTRCILGGELLETKEDFTYEISL
ncbi:hypothetical protein BGZ68_010744 [Mortierella alpina]|nr:hypothetical protein BGZ68_010744 [Mortierella alpina]